MKQFIVICLIALTLTGCATPTPATQSHLQQGRRDFDSGYYKGAMDNLLPIATDGNAEAQYAVGYMYFYGYGVAQDKSTGTFWVKRSADQKYAPAINALKIIQKK